MNTNVNRHGGHQNNRHDPKHNFAATMPMIEPLETRTLLSAAPANMMLGAKGVLTIDEIGHPFTMSVALGVSRRSEVVNIGINRTTYQYAASALSRIVVEEGFRSRSDVVRVARGLNYTIYGTTQGTDVSIDLSRFYSPAVTTPVASGGGGTGCAGTGDNGDEGDTGDNGTDNGANNGGDTGTDNGNDGGAGFTGGTGGDTVDTGNTGSSGDDNGDGFAGGSGGDDGGDSGYAGGGDDGGDTGDDGGDGGDFARFARTQTANTAKPAPTPMATLFNATTLIN